MNIYGKTTAVALVTGLLLAPGGLRAAEADSTVVSGSINDVVNNDAVTVSGGSINDVVVTGTRQATSLSHLPMNVTVINRSQLTENFQQSVLPTLAQEVPGLFVSSRGMMGYGISGGGSGALNLRGLSGGPRVLVLIDGHPQYANIFDHPIGDAYQTMMADRVEVVSGPASVLYGSNAMGGVVNIVTRKMQQDGTHTSFNIGAGSWGTVQAEASNQLRRGRFTSTVAAQYGRSDNHRPRMGFEQFGGYLNMGYDLGEHLSARLTADVTHFNASHPGTVGSPLFEAKQHITRGVANLSLQNRYDRVEGALMVYTNLGRHKINDGYGPSSNGGQPRDYLFRSDDALTGVSLYQTLRLFEGSHLTVGADYQHIYGYAYQTNRSDGAKRPTNFKAGTGKSFRNEWACYADFRQDLTAWLTADAGVRYDWQSISGGEWVPQFGLAARPVADGQLKLTAGKGFRNPSMMELYFYGNQGNLDLKAERLWNYELSWQHAIGSFSYKANVYYLKADNIIVSTPLNTGGYGPRHNSGPFENSGYELQASYQVTSHFAVHANRSYIHQQAGHEQAGTPEYVDYLGLRWLQGRFGVNAGTQHVSHLCTDDGEQTFTLVSATVTYRPASHATLWLRGENLLCQEYEINAGYPMPRATFMGGVNIGF